MVYTPIMPYKEKLDKLLKYTRPEEIALFNGVSTQSIYRWRIGKRVPHRIFIKKIEEFFNMKEIKRRNQQND